MEGISDIVAQAVQSKHAGNHHAHGQYISELEALGCSSFKIDQLLRRYEAQLPSTSERHGCGGTIPNLQPAA